MSLETCLQHENVHQLYSSLVDSVAKGVSKFTMVLPGHCHSHLAITSAASRHLQPHSPRVCCVFVTSVSRIKMSGSVYKRFRVTWAVLIDRTSASGNG